MLLMTAPQYQIFLLVGKRLSLVVLNEATEDGYESFAEYDPANSSLSAWSIPFRVGNDAGPPGPAGSKGSPGAKGDTGDTGAAGAAGATGAQGIYQINLYRQVAHNGPAPSAPQAATYTGTAIENIPSGWQTAFFSNIDEATFDYYKSFAEYNPATNSLGNWAVPYKVSADAGVTGPAGPQGPIGPQGDKG